MLNGIHPLLGGKLLVHLDAMGHSDTVVIADAHFPAARLANRVIHLRGSTTTEAIRAVHTVLPLDEGSGLDLMHSPSGEPLPIHHELLHAVGSGTAANYLGRPEFYDAARDAYLIIRTGETRTFGNAIRSLTRFPGRFLCVDHAAISAAV